MALVNFLAPSGVRADSTLRLIAETMAISLENTALLESRADVSEAATALAVVGAATKRALATGASGRMSRVVVGNSRP